MHTIHLLICILHFHRKLEATHSEGSLPNKPLDKANNKALRPTASFYFCSGEMDYYTKTPFLVHKDQASEEEQIHLLACFST